MIMNGKILTISAHPDDWELGCYATIERLKREGCEVYHYIMGAGRGDRLDNKFDSVSLLDWIESVETAIEEHKPDVIFTHYEYDLNIDHQIVYKAVITAARPACCVKEIYSFEVLSSTEWNCSASYSPDIFVRVAEKDIVAKQKFISKFYPEEIREYPHPRSTEGILALAMYRGMQCGRELAEAFKTVRRII